MVVAIVAVALGVGSSCLKRYWDEAWGTKLATPALLEALRHARTAGERDRAVNAISINAQRLVDALIENATREGRTGRLARKAISSIHEKVR